MADSSDAKKHHLEDSLTSEDWTIIYKKEPKVNNLTDKKINSKKYDKTEETKMDSENNSSKECFKSQIEPVEKCEEADETAVESDDISVISYESDAENVVQECRIESIEKWQIERKESIESKELIPKSSSNVNISSNILIFCSVMVLIVGTIIANFYGAPNFMGNKPSSVINNQEKLKENELIRIEEKLKELNEVKQALDLIKISMPIIQQTYEEREKNKIEYLTANNNNFKNLNIQNILNSNVYDNRLEMLEVTYQNFCLTINKFNSSNSIIENKLCNTPKILTDMIIFKKNLKQVLKQNQETDTFDRRILVDAERKLDYISESLLTELSTIFSRFSMKMQERLNKFGKKLYKKMCSLYNNKKADDKFLNSLLNDEFLVNNCNETLNIDSDAINMQSNVSQKEEKYHGIKKKSYENLNKNNAKYDDKNEKNYKKIDDPKENSYEKKYNEELMNIKSKGEVKYDSNWKKNKYENKEKYFQEEKKYKYEKSNNNKNEYKTKSNFEYDYDNTFKNNKEHDYNRKFKANKEEQDFDYNKIDDFNRKFDANKKDHEFYEKLIKYDKKNDEFNYKFNNKKNYDYDNSKFILNEIDKESRNNEEKYRYKNDKEYISKPENFKESKYSKYQGNEDKDKNYKHQHSSDWQMQRARTREKMRNIDWYFARADSRQKARVAKDEAKMSSTSSSPHRRSQRYKND